MIVNECKFTKNKISRINIKSKQLSAIQISNNSKYHWYHYSMWASTVTLSTLTIESGCTGFTWEVFSGSTSGLWSLGTQLPVPQKSSGGCWGFTTSASTAHLQGIEVQPCRPSPQQQLVLHHAGICISSMCNSILPTGFQLRPSEVQLFDHGWHAIFAGCKLRSSKAIFVARSHHNLRLLPRSECSP